MSTNVYRFFCDESCHLDNNGDPLVIGTLKVPKSKVPLIADEIRNIKSKHGVPAKVELKWNNLSKSRFGLYEDLVNYFFNSEHLGFRVVIASKDNLRHDQYEQSHQEWFFKIYYQTLLTVLTPETAEFEIFIDQVDTGAVRRAARLKEFLNKKLKRDAVLRVQVIDSRDSQLMQLTDIFVGAFSYHARKLGENSNKNSIVDLIKNRSGLDLTKPSPLKASKMNVFFWNGQH